jgi:hypothetical protein
MAWITWLCGTPLNGFAGLVGVTIGIFYGFDGWRGNTSELDFQDSPRVKNLLYVLGAGFTAFIGDVKALDPEAKKDLVLLAYFLPCFVSGLVVVVFWGAVIGIGQLVETLRGRDHGYGFANALADYFFWIRNT